MNNMYYEKPEIQCIKVDNTCIICASTIKKCPNCGSTSYDEVQVEDKAKRIKGVVSGLLGGLLNPGNVNSYARAQMSTHAMKTVRICKKCHTQWDVD